MLIFTADHAPDQAEALRQTVAEAAPGAEIHAFHRDEDLLQAIREEGMMPDLALVQAGTSVTEGMSLAKQLKSFSRSIRVILIADTENYAMEAYRQHLQGYLLHPVSSAQIREELAYVFPDSVSNANTYTDPGWTPDPVEKIQIRCFGTFAAFWQKKPIAFRRKRTMELLAFLVDRRGAASSAEEVIDVLFENAEPDSMKKAKQNLRNLIFDLHLLLSEIGQENVLIRTRSTIAICPERLDCDYYRLLEGEPKAQREFIGEYMEQYSWAEHMKGKLMFQEEEPSV